MGKTADIVSSHLVLDRVKLTATFAAAAHFPRAWLRNQAQVVRPTASVIPAGAHGKATVQESVQG
jgi:hypothetical protein